MLAFALGWPTSELPLHAIGWQALATLGFIRKGALRTPAGLAGLGLTAASWAGLHRIWKDSLPAGAAPRGRDQPWMLRVWPSPRTT